MIIKKQSAASSILDILDGHRLLIKLLKKQQDAARALYESQKDAGQYSKSTLLQLVQLEMIATSAERLFTEQGWLLNSLDRVAAKIDAQDQQRIADEVDAEMEQEKARQEQLLLDAWYMFDPS